MARVQSTAVGWWDLEARQDQWKKDPAKQTAFSSDAAHGNDILRWFLGSEAVRAYSQWTSYSGFVPGESSMTVYTWRNGVLSDYWMTYELPEPGLGSMSFLLAGDQGMLRLDMYGRVELSRPEGGWEVVFEQEPFDPLNAVDPRRLRAYAAQIVPEARGQAQRVRTVAEGYKTASVVRAQGDGDRFSMVVDAYKDAPDVTRKRLWLETMQEVLGGSRKIVGGDSRQLIYVPMAEKAATKPDTNIGPPLLTPELLAPTVTADDAADARVGRTARPAGREEATR